MVDALLGLQSLLVNAKVDVEPQLGQLLAAVKVSEDWCRHWSRSVLMSVRVGVCQGQCCCQPGSVLALVKVRVGVGVSQGQCCCQGWCWGQSRSVLLSVRVGVSIGQGQCCYQAGTVKVSVAVSQGQGCCQSGSLLASVKVSAIVSQQQGWNKSWSCQLGPLFTFAAMVLWSPL